MLAFCGSPLASTFYFQDVLLNLDDQKKESEMYGSHKKGEKVFQSFMQNIDLIYCSGFSAGKEAGWF